MILKCFVSVRRILILAVSPNEQLKTTCHFPRYVYNSKAQLKSWSFHVLNLISSVK